MPTKQVGYRIDKSTIDDYERFCEKRFLDKTKLLEGFMRLIVSNEAGDEIIAVLNKFSQI